MNKEIPLFKVFMSQTAAQKATEVLNSGFIGQGEFVDKFESILVDYFKYEYISTLNSATSAEHLALHLIKKHRSVTVLDGYSFKDEVWDGKEEEDEVLTTPLTCTATNWPILANDFKIKWVDIDTKTLNMDLDDLERKITKKTKAIAVVHWGGYPNDLDRLKQIQDKSMAMYGTKPVIIEDCAHAMGSKYKNKLIGTHGNMCTFSLQAIKHITSIDGGLLFVPHEELHRRAQLLRWYGIDRKGPRKDFRCESDIKEWGFKFHMNDVNASVGIENFKHVDFIVDKHKSNAKFYDENLQNINGLQLLERNPDMESSFWIYSLLVDKKQDFMKYMKECGICVSQVHERNDMHSCVKEFRSCLPNVDKTVPKVLSIPVGWWVTEEDRQYIVDCIKKGW
jgi:dTDP-4-amino-4,6-dideoxygalactose transaminase